MTSQPVGSGKPEPVTARRWSPSARPHCIQRGSERNSVLEMACHVKKDIPAAVVVVVVVVPSCDTPKPVSTSPSDGASIQAVYVFPACNVVILSSFLALLL